MAKDVDRRLLDRAAARDPRIVDQNVNWSVPGGDGREAAAHRGVVIDVERLDVDGELFFGGDLAQVPGAIEISHRRRNHMPGPGERDSCG
jgi:hypothetical protein